MSQTLGLGFSSPFDKCIFEIAAWQVVIKAVNKLIHPHTHYLTIRRTKSEGPGCDQAGAEDNAFGQSMDTWLLSAGATSLRLTWPFVM